MSVEFSVLTPAPPAGPAKPLPPGIVDLVLRMRAGDREAVGAFVEHYGPFVRRRVRGKLKPSMRRLFDSQEILSTITRRLDRYVQSGRIRADSENQLWALVFKMVDAALIDRARVIRRLRHVEGEDTDFARRFLGRLDHAGCGGDDAVDVEVDAALRSLPSAADRQILSMWLMGNSLRIIAEYLGISHDAARQRWQSIREKLRASLEEGAI